MKVIEHVNLLGLKAEDKVTGFKGVITCVSFDLYGRIQVVITPEVDPKSGKKEDGHWHGISRVKLKSKKPVMNVPDFDKGYIAEGKKGNAEKPERNLS